MKVHSVMDAGLDKRERILAAASQLIVKNGLQCSMAAIADTAGVATGSLYNYFKSKEEMILAVYDRLALVMAEKMIPLDPQSLHPAERLRRYIEDYIDFILDDPERAILFEYLSNVPLIPAAQMGEAFGPVSQYTTFVVTEAKQADLLGDFSVTFMGGYIGGGIRNTLKWRRAEPTPLSPEERQQIVAMSLAAISLH
jgi:AcrR family transcriptional regulator